MNLNQVPQQNPAVASQMMEGEAVLVHPQQGKVKVLNAVGARIWSLLDGQRSAGDIANAVSDLYSIPRDRAAQDTLSFLESLLTREFIFVDPA